MVRPLPFRHVGGWRIKLYSTANISTAQSRTSELCDLGKNLTRFCDIDVPASRADHNVNRRDEDVSLPI
jgi:hypothetical protein